MARRITPGIRTPNVRGAGVRTARTKTRDPHARNRQVAKQAKIATGNVMRAQQGTRSVGRGGVVTKSGTTAAAFRAGAPVDKTEPARIAAARATGMKVGLPIATSRPVSRKVTRVPTRIPSRGGRR
jgi:hypothetical protein